MLNDRRIILGSLIVLIGLLLVGFFSPISSLFHSDTQEEVEFEVFEMDKEQAQHYRERTHKYRAQAERYRQHADSRRYDSHGDFDYDEVTERAFTVQEGQTLFLKTDLGQVSVEGEDTDQVVVRVTKATKEMSEQEAKDLFSRFNLSFDQTAEGIVVTGDLDGSRHHKLHIAFEIVIPLRFNVEVKTAGGSITAESFEGEALLQTAGGSVSVEAIDGPVHVNTSGGSITAEKIDGNAMLQTAGGSITVEQVKGDVEAYTSGGSVNLTDIYGSVNAETSGGSINADVAVAPKDPMVLETSGGSIKLSLIDGAAVAIDARASGGSVHSEFAVEGLKKRDLLEGEINGGGPQLTLRTSGGGIRISKR